VAADEDRTQGVEVMATLLVSDNHWGHAGIIRLANRPFDNVEAMNHYMRSEWNAVVRKDDTVIHLGDFAHRFPADRLPSLFESLNGRKHLIAGNHDDKHTLALPWESISDVVHASIDSQRVTLSHFAWRTWPGIRKGALMLYGHSHGRLAGNSQSMDIGVDVVGYRPLRINEIKAYLAALPPLADPEGGEDFENDGGLKP
jgi:calcineurin-like phosphoesterase family protein